MARAKKRKIEPNLRVIGLCGELLERGEGDKRKKKRRLYGVVVSASGRNVWNIHWDGKSTTEEIKSCRLTVVAPIIIIPKKNGTVQFISDFRYLNKCLIMEPYPIPKMANVLQQIEGLEWAASLDLNMGYYTVDLDPYSQKLCTIVTSWGKNQHSRLYMGVNVSDGRVGG